VHKVCLWIVWVAVPYLDAESVAVAVSAWFSSVMGYDSEVVAWRSIHGSARVLKRQFYIIIYMAAEKETSKNEFKV
jgi:hypothetical protein